MNKKRIFISSIVSIVIISFAYLLINVDPKNKHPSSKNTTMQIRKPIHINEKTWSTTVTLSAIGDILIHDRVYEDARIENGYDFKPMLQGVKEYLQKPHLLLANQETILGGIEIGLSSYPSFNSPHEVGDALIDSGVDIVSTANNHTLDRGEKAIINAINYYESTGLPYVGHFKDDKDRQTLRILTTNGIKVAYLSYTYGTNGIPVPEGKEHLVNLIDKEKMKDEIHRAKEQADIVVMSLHWGNEYQRLPTEEQKELAQFLADEGIDILFGHHPHVLQPMEFLKAKDDRNVFVVYSLGNFLSGQMWDYKDIGGIASIEVTKKVHQDKTNISLANPQFFPTYVSSSNLQNYRIVPLENADKAGLTNAKEKYNEIMNHMFQWLN
ncbi:CapA family protein [Bacillus aquiflavi]|uniref:CapA family protein n=1 Tax=Bacillus aquiflavi TaxID=2672567 RepID=A0A6B3W4F7_9BACI|nr:CapA family protein [Bacillus aquiflavi]MBA4538510.1 CapA family protein [Bacillus aquiflavi]NEY82873.1 CapA family protein [Bacillus aquiflavi]